MWNISTVSDCCRCADEVKSLRLGAGQFAQLSNGRAMTERGKGEEVEERESEGGSSLPDPAESRWVCGGGGNEMWMMNGWSDLGMMDNERRE